MRRLLAGVLGAGLTLVSAPVAQADSALEQALVVDGMPGAIAVVRTGDTVTQYSAGVADLSDGRPFVPHTHIRAASITKTFVAAVMLQLVASGDIDLDAPVAQYLPGKLPADITVKYLLRHQSGLPEYFEPGDDPDGFVGSTDPTTLVDEALAEPLRFAPGTQMAYTNTNYLVAGQLIEAATGRSAVDAIASRIIAPLGLSDTYFPAADDRGLATPFASGYEQQDGQSVDETAFPASLAGMAGALVSTGEDLTTFVTALLAGRLVPAAQLADMMATVPQFGTDIGYGLGLASFTLSCGVTVWGHGGDIEGYHSLMVKPVEPVDAPGLSVTFTQSPDAQSMADDPRGKVAEALYC